MMNPGPHTLPTLTDHTGEAMLGVYGRQVVAMGVPLDLSQDPPALHGVRGTRHNISPEKMGQNISLPGETG